ncbi:alpha-glucosidase [Paremcibacter congregatus]|uniref:Alpha-glucosidase n=1 Tax=Paremcibacter congregatus TaxID=2043170 RepID=A0A2G4YS81_9PROT|nr:alpha-glucosidase [Paremcibacter congregatus]PHZ85120.1 alpha-glucosidase [Paremcibacter congregatus]QDE27945.1 alpha-glucosidase [Paremcibacter congregatus]
MKKINWWNGAVIYQIYPRSLMDSNGDGIGDIPGIINQLDYIKSLGVDAIWISPFFKSPMKDFGYDIADYRDIDPLFGTLDDFDQLIRESHARDVKVIIDQVLSHTSDQHAWFQESRMDRENPKADWYVWADAKADGDAPNNWLAIFGGSAWQWDAGRGQYYLHNFLTSQPDLNYHCPALRAQVLQEVEFWLRRGVDGFRLDAINFCFHDAELRDNPAKPMAERRGRGFSPDNPYAAQYHVYDNDRPETLDFLEQLRALLDRYPGVMSMGEINTEDSLKSIADYTADNKRLHMGYSFELLVDDFSARHIRETVEQQMAHLNGAQPCWAISNHDVKRVLSRWGGDNPSPEMAKMLTALLCSLPGTICTYQGEELGLTEANIAHADLQDPFGIKFWPDFKGRDGCRTPMPWTSDAPHAGFSDAAPWLPVPTDHLAVSVEAQEIDPDSVLNAFKNFLSWRKSHPALLHGDIKFLDSPDGTLTFVRTYKGESILAVFNLTGKKKRFFLPEDSANSSSPQNAIQCNLPPFGMKFNQGN